MTQLPAEPIGSPADRMRDLIWVLFPAQAICVAARLGLADLLSSGPESVDELARATRAHAPALRRLLRALASVGIFAENPAGEFEQTPMSELLCADHPRSVRIDALFSAFLWKPWSELYASVTTGRPAFELLHGRSLFEHLAHHPDDAALFDAAMSRESSSSAAAIVEAYDFSRFESVVDVGGGRGVLLQAILRKWPTVRGVLFDLPAVVAAAGTAEPSAGRLALRGGDFFSRVPGGGDAYVLKHIIHDWSDDDAARILENCRRAMPGHGTLLLIDIVLQAENEREAGFMDLTMLLLTRGRERTETEFRALLRDAGFVLDRVIPTAGSQSIIECRLA